LGEHDYHLDESTHLHNEESADHIMYCKTAELQCTVKESMRRLVHFYIITEGTCLNNAHFTKTPHKGENINFNNYHQTV